MKSKRSLDPVIVAALITAAGVIGAEVLRIITG